MRTDIVGGFIEGFANSIKLEYAFSISKFVLGMIEKGNPEVVRELYDQWDSIIRKGFADRLAALEQVESLSADEKKALNLFLESLIKEIKE